MTTQAKPHVIANDAITSSKILDGAVVAGKLGTNAVVEANIEDGAVSSDKLAAGAASVSGEIKMYAGSSAPTGWLLCDGSTVSQTTYAALFAVVGANAFGTDAGGNFDLPDFRGRTAIGVGTGSGLTARAMGDEVGVETHQLITAELAAHTHTANNGFGGYTASGGAEKSPSGGATSGSTGSDTAHQTMQPSLAVNYIIKT